MTTSETDVLDPTAEPIDGPLELSNGVKVNVSRLKTRETMKLLKILTRGASYALGSLSLDSGSEEFAEALVLAVALAIPEAEDETLDFLRVMVSPSDLITGNKLSKAEKEINEEVEAKFIEATENPELEDTLAIVTRIAQVEAPHIQELGKRLGLLLKAYRPEKS